MAQRRLSEKINIGVADITFTPEGTDIPIYLGLTKDGTTLTYEPEYYDITADQTGNTPLDSILIGETVKVTTNLLDTSLEHIAAVVPTADKEEEGGKIKAVTFGRRPGLRLGNRAGVLRVHPVSAGVGRTDKDVIIYRAANKANLELAYELENEWVIPCEFVGFPDDFRPEGDQLFRIGEYTKYKQPNKRIVSFWITPANPEIKIGEMINFKCNAMYEDGTTEDLTSEANWVSSAPEIATIKLEGNTAVATGVTTGTVVIQAQLIGYSSSTTLTVHSV
ncbi:hypothetical protein [Tepidimicrobium xylanilyticum]|uniref:BIG2 domain-containing protein n=1 Tax=Tepidimicrobium xylanilyticum TaxID=1123352 RepID=A0A1H3ELV7_9FIRM|nr:hypothetical protein [Tepidimicrobium xylanilyticum]SDX78919.1 hypothetical protein SAMN05660923_02937 [Tepidimicrobium xylanilyticum]